METEFWIALIGFKAIFIVLIVYGLSGSRRRPFQPRASTDAEAAAIDPKYQRLVEEQVSTFHRDREHRYDDDVRDFQQWQKDCVEKYGYGD